LCDDSCYRLKETKEMRLHKLLLGIGALAAALSLTGGLNSALAANHLAGDGVKVAVAKSGLGRVLVDGRGRTLYLFEKDKRGKSACSGHCAGSWPPLIATGKPLATAGAKASLLGTTKRADGRLQVTYNHHPLYTFVNDVRKGQTNGEEVDAFGAKWYAVSAGGAKVEPENDAKSSAGDPAPGGYDYGY
jgi:predicted lipoprotein with Yx(FWY)xxD motif